MISLCLTFTSYGQNDSLLVRNSVNFQVMGNGASGYGFITPSLNYSRSKMLNYNFYSFYGAGFSWECYNSFNFYSIFTFSPKDLFLPVHYGLRYKISKIYSVEACGVISPLVPIANGEHLSDIVNAYALFQMGFNVHLSNAFYAGVYLTEYLNLKNQAHYSLATVKVGYFFDLSFGESKRGIYKDVTWL